MEGVVGNINTHRYTDFLTLFRITYEEGPHREFSEELVGGIRQKGRGPTILSPLGIPLEPSVHKVYSLGGRRTLGRTVTPPSRRGLLVHMRNPRIYSFLFGR